jgi:hypothetical protein
VFFFNFLAGIGGFLIFDMGLGKKGRQLIVHYTPRGGSTVIVAAFVPLPYELGAYEVVSPIHGQVFFFNNNDC